MRIRTLKFQSMTKNIEVSPAMSCWGGWIPQALRKKMRGLIFIYKYINDPRIHYLPYAWLYKRNCQLSLIWIKKARISLRADKLIQHL